MKIEKNMSLKKNKIFQMIHWINDLLAVVLVKEIKKKFLG